MFEEQIVLLYRPVEDGTYYVITRGYGCEILLVDRSYQGGVQCTGIITLA